RFRRESRKNRKCHRAANHTPDNRFHNCENMPQAESIPQPCDTLPLMTVKGLLWIAFTTVTAAFAMAQPQTQLPDGEGKKILESVCTVCHSLNEVTKFKGFYSRENWRDIIQTMVADGAPLKETDSPVLLDYLAKTFPKDFPDGEGKK